jgi:hypothetical protein
MEWMMSRETRYPLWIVQGWERRHLAGFGASNNHPQK